MEENNTTIEKIDEPTYLTSEQIDELRMDLLNLSSIQDAYRALDKAEGYLVSNGSADQRWESVSKILYSIRHALESEELKGNPFAPGLGVSFGTVMLIAITELGIFSPDDVISAFSLNSSLFGSAGNNQA